MENETNVRVQFVFAERRRVLTDTGLFAIQDIAIPAGGALHGPGLIGAHLANTGAGWKHAKTIGCNVTSKGLLNMYYNIGTIFNGLQ